MTYGLCAKPYTLHNNTYPLNYPQLVKLTINNCILLFLLRVIKFYQKKKNISVLIAYLILMLLPTTNHWDSNGKQYIVLGIQAIKTIFARLTVRAHSVSSIFGFFLVITLLLQILSGIALSFSLIPEPMYIPLVRDEEDIEVPYIDVFFWLHERGVDTLFLIFYYHLLRKVYLYVFHLEQETVWKSGVLAFMIFQVVTFLGLVLCCTHLSDVTLAIACNILHTFTNFTGKTYSWFFTDKHLNSDTIIRLAYAHYLSAFALFYIGVIHAMSMHYDWKSDYLFEGTKIEIIWFEEVLSGELIHYMDVLFIIWLIGFILFTEPEPLSYEIFMWGDIGAICDVRYAGVAPHWYFRPFMAWLLVCPLHRTGIFGLMLFFFSLYNQISIINFSSRVVKSSFGLKTIQTGSFYNFFFKKLSKVLFWVFIMALLYTTTFLPAGKFYKEIGGNIIMFVAYMYVLSFFLFDKLRTPVELNTLTTTNNLVNL